MKPLSQRSAFTALMTLFATLSGGAYGAYELRAHPDLITDTLKIGALIGIVTLCVSFIFWIDGMRRFILPPRRSSN